MAYFCVVAPSQILKEMKDAKTLNWQHLLLAHDVVQHAETYREILEVISRHSFALTIMDNSVIETGAAVDLKMIREALRIVPSTCVVLPDVLEKTEETIQSCTEALSQWAKHIYTSFMMCPQGKTLADFTRCAEAFADHHQIHFWGVPRNLVKNIGTRREAIQVLKTINPKRKIHMLGFSDDMIDDVLCAQHPNVYSIDSAVPIRLGAPLNLTSKVPPREVEWWDHGHLDDFAVDNIAKVKAWVDPKHA